MPHMPHTLSHMATYILRLPITLAIRPVQRIRSAGKGAFGGSHPFAHACH